MSSSTTTIAFDDVQPEMSGVDIAKIAMEAAKKRIDSIIRDKIMAEVYRKAQVLLSFSDITYHQDL